MHISGFHLIPYTLTEWSEDTSSGRSYFCSCTTLRLLSSSLFTNCCCFRPNSCDDARSVSLDARGNVGKPGKIARLCWPQAEENKVTCGPTSWSGKNDLLHPLPLTSLMFPTFRICCFSYFYPYFFCNSSSCCLDFFWCRSNRKIRDDVGWQQGRQQGMGLKSVDVN